MVMIVDAHYHLDERIETVDALLKEMNREGVERVALMGRLTDPLKVPALLRIMAPRLCQTMLGRWGWLGLTVYRSTVTADGEFSALGRTYPIDELPDNDLVAAAMRAHPDRFWGWIFVNPRAADPRAELERCAGEPGWIGVKAHPFWHRYPVALLDDVAEYCVGRNWPLLVHLGGEREGNDPRTLPEWYPKLKIVYAHAGVPWYREVWAVARERDQVFVDLSNPLYVCEQVRLQAIQALGAERCLYGTDGPYLQASQGRMLQGIDRLPLTDREKELVLGGNFTNLLGN
jgi:predicted TIM-barrel fold metal-dependent hydrolase